MDDSDDYGGGCCPKCCRSPDLGVHDFCVPCATSPTCTRAAPRPVRQTDLEPYGRVPVRFATAETEARVAAKKQKDEEEAKKKRHGDDKKNGRAIKDKENEKSCDDDKQKSRHHKHKEGHGKKNKESAKAGDDEKPMTGHEK